MKNHVIIAIVCGLFSGSCSSSQATNASMLQQQCHDLGFINPAALPEPQRETVRSNVPEASGDIHEVIAYAQEHLGKNTVRVQGRTYRYDCSGFIRGIFSVLGIDLFEFKPKYKHSNGVDLIYNYIEEKGFNHFEKRPHVGDVVYFNNSYDQNQNGLLDDPLTHIGIVVSLDNDGTVSFIHRTSTGIDKDVMNLLHPNQRYNKSGEIINSYVRKAQRRDPPGTLYYASQLFAGFGRIIQSKAK